MVNQHPDKELQIKKGQLWELWLISPTRELILGAFPTLEELNQAQITLYHSWENPHLSHRSKPVTSES